MAYHLPRRLGKTRITYPNLNIISPVSTSHRNFLTRGGQDTKLLFVQMHLMTCLDEPTHREKRLVHLHDLEAHDHRGRTPELGDDVSALLTKIDNDTAIGDFVFRSHLTSMNQRQVTSNVRRNNNLRCAAVNGQYSPFPFGPGQICNSADRFPSPESTRRVRGKPLCQLSS